MFIYENGNSLNLTFKGSIPVENPEISIMGYENGASLTVNGENVITVSDAKEFEGKAKTFVFQKDGKLMITFKGIEGINNPEVVIDEKTSNVFDVTINNSSVTLTIENDGVVIGEKTTTEEPVEETPEKVAEPVVPEVEPEEEVTTEPETTEPEEDEGDAE